MIGVDGLGPVFPLCLGGNVFGWTADERESFAVLDAYADAGGNFIDTADSYSSWKPGNRGGESETIIGRWMRSRGNREEMVIATKVSRAPGLRGLTPDTIAKAAKASLRRLGTDRIELYYAHFDDPGTPLAETLGAFSALVEAGRVRRIAASNYSAGRLASALSASEQAGLARYCAVQAHYNLLRRAEFERDVQPICADQGLVCFPYFALARGFLTGKYRGRGTPNSRRNESVAEYLDKRGFRVLAALDEIAAEHSTTVAATALAWLAQQDTVGSPIASARTPAQLAELLPMAGLRLADDEVERLRAASDPTFSAA